MAHVSISQAHKMTGVARSTIYKDIDEGKLSVSTNARGKKSIMVAELERVYGNVEVEKTKVKSDNTSVSQDVSTVVERPNEDKKLQHGQVAVLQERIGALQVKVDTQSEFIDDLKQERKNQRELFEEQVNGLKEALNKAQDGYNNMTKLLEDKSGEGKNNDDWTKAIKALEQRIANQEETAKEEKEKAQKQYRINKQLHAKLKALEAEKKENEETQKKGWFQKLFG